MMMKMKTGFIIVSKEAVSMLLFASCGGRACDRLDMDAAASNVAGSSTSADDA